jgi:glycosyltransferase involved in cell wall biosynthesis
LTNNALSPNGEMTLKCSLLEAKKPTARKICVVYASPFPTIGGAETLVYELSKSLSEKNHVLVACQPFDSNSEQLTFGNKNLRRFPILRKGTIGFVTNFFAIFQLLLKERVDFVHAHYVFPAATWGVVGKLFGASITVTSHGQDIQTDKAIGYGWRLNKFIALITWLTLKLVDVHVVLSKSMVKDAIASGSNPSKIRVVYNGIDLKKIRSVKSTNIFQQFGLKKEDLILLYLGRLHPKKCPDDLIKALPKVAQVVPNVRLVFAGAGGERDKLEKLASSLNIGDKVIFTGFVSEDEKWDLLKNCDVFVLPSIVEGHPITLIEAMACGKPVMTTDSGPFPEIVKNGETGILVPLHSPDCLAEGIINLAMDDEKRRAMGIKARKDVEERFDINRVACAYSKIFAVTKKRS